MKTLRVKDGNGNSVPGWTFGCNSLVTVYGQAELLARIQDYLSNGGLFNPEMMEHDKVRQLIMDCREYIQSH